VINIVTFVNKLKIIIIIMETPKRTGRPVHPLWAHFHRGEKRNRYHYHAFCSYCVARHGTEQVPPTRGVSSDMLRHLEMCPNCPRNVVEALKEICGRRERNAHDKKQAAAAGNSSSRNNGDTSRLEEVDEDQVLLLNAVAAAQAQAASVASMAQAETATIETEGGHVGGKRTASEALAAVQEARLDQVGEGVGGERRGTSKAGQNAALDSTDFLTMTTKRGRTDSGNAVQQDLTTRWKVCMLQTAVAAGIPLSAFQRREFQELLKTISPDRVDSDLSISSIGGQPFLEETAAKLACSQLERVKEGMLNSTIKSGLTLSVTCWRTLDLQQLVAFSLLNSNGDAACVRVEDISGHVQQHNSAGGDGSPMALLRPAQLLPLARAIEDVLIELNEKSICVIGIVADSAVALSAAKRVCCSERWRSLLVVPCMSALLTSLAGSVLTHEVFHDAVGQLVELAAYFSNPQLQASLRAISGENDARIPLPTRAHWFSLVDSLTKALHYSDAITAVCSSRRDGGSPMAPTALRELVLGNNGSFWKRIRELAELLAPLREAYSLVFQPKPSVGDASDNEEECATIVHAGLTLAHVMYQLGRMSQQYAAIAEATGMSSVSSGHNGEDTAVVAERLHEHLDAMWQRFDLPAMVLAFVFDFHMDTSRLDMSNSALQWKAVSSYFQLYFERWCCKSSPDQSASGSSPAAPVPSDKVNELLNAFQLHQFPFDAETTSDYSDVSSFYSFISESNPEICALCCRVYAVALSCADVRRVVRGVGFLPSEAQTIQRPEQVELLLHVGFASSWKKVRRPAGTDAADVLSDLLQASRPEELLCSQEDWEAFASDWKQVLDHELAVDELEQLQQLQDYQTAGSRPSKPSTAFETEDENRLSLDQLFFEALPPLPAAVVVAPSPHDAVTQASVDL
jgi:hypothetical protein